MDRPWAAAEYILQVKVTTRPVGSLRQSLFTSAVFMMQQRRNIAATRSRSMVTALLIHSVGITMTKPLDGQTRLAEAEFLVRLVNSP